MSCDQATIGVTAGIDGDPRELYRAKGVGIQDMFVDWLRGTVYWLEGLHLLSMGVQGGPAKGLLNLTSGFTGTMALDLQANALLWTTHSAGGWTALGRWVDHILQENASFWLYLILKENQAIE